MFYSVQRDEVYCKIRCPLERLEREAVSLQRIFTGSNLAVRFAFGAGRRFGVTRY